MFGLASCLGVFTTCMRARLATANIADPKVRSNILDQPLALGRFQFSATEDMTSTQCLFVGSMSQLVRCRLQLSLELSVVLGKATIGADHRSRQHRGPTMGTAVRPAKTSPGPWDAFADVDAFVDEVLAELEAMAKDGNRPMRSGPRPPLAGAALRKAVMAIWCVCFCGMQW